MTIKEIVQSLEGKSKPEIIDFLINIKESQYE